jgi:hypothetical protein
MLTYLPAFLFTCLPACLLLACLPASAQAVSHGHEAIKAMCVAIDDWAKQVGKPKRTRDLVLPPEGLEDAVRGLIGMQVRFNISALICTEFI